jgi:hypothetical protein
MPCLFAKDLLKAYFPQSCGGIPESGEELHSKSYGLNHEKTVSQNGGSKEKLAMRS